MFSTIQNCCCPPKFFYPLTQPSTSIEIHLMLRQRTSEESCIKSILYNPEDAKKLLIENASEIDSIARFCIKDSWPSREDNRPGLFWPGLFRPTTFMEDNRADLVRNTFLYYEGSNHPMLGNQPRDAFFYFTNADSPGDVHPFSSYLDKHPFPRLSLNLALELAEHAKHGPTKIAMILNGQKTRYTALELPRKVPLDGA